jgi:hypothetical protein
MFKQDMKKYTIIINDLECKFIHITKEDSDGLFE